LTIIYSEENSTFIPGLFCNPNKQYLKHFKNQMYLEFIFKNTDDRVERHQANKELEICRRKLAYWEKKPGFNVNLAAEECKKEKIKWT
jgi:hypothetical protein